MQDLPIGIGEFSELRKRNCVYVDKTKFAYRLLTKETRSFLSRPRRFGKSLFLSTLEAILRGKKELFRDLWIENSGYDWTPWGVMRMDFSRLRVESVQAFNESLVFMLNRIGLEEGVVLPNTANIGILFPSLVDALRKKHYPLAILIDEYDYPILHSLQNRPLAEKIREELKSLSTLIKAEGLHIQFVFVTGVSAFSKSGLSSGLNNLTNLTMFQDFSDVCGYTDLEVDRYFGERIRAWADAEKIPYQQLRDELKAWYNGYCFAENTPTLYSPFSLTSSLHMQRLQNFWFESATPAILLDELQKEQRQKESKLLELDQLRGTGDLLQTFEIENLPLTALLFQMGYLTIDSYNPLSRNYQLKYPNLEVKASFHRHLAALITKIPPIKINPLIGDLYSFLVEEDVASLVSALQEILSHIPYSLHIDQEKFYHALLQVIFTAAGMEVCSEKATSSGRMDLVLELPNLIYVVELKMGVSPQVAITQILEKRYYEPFLYKKKPIIALGISFLRKKTSKKQTSSFLIEYAVTKVGSELD